MLNTRGHDGLCSEWGKGWGCLLSKIHSYCVQRWRYSQRGNITLDEKILFYIDTFSLSFWVGVFIILTERKLSQIE